ncbi:EamA family transporter [Actinophytocola sp.]|uniref:EamA family transporter n=1 Tax=Actinophytocola sp. TaxID=1872138 RepID=UPI0025BE87BA|nr:EamA family transporter [Actinophytocola sp.]
MRAGRRGGRSAGWVAMLAMLLALGASLGWGAGDFLGGLKSRSMPLLSVLVVTQSTSLAMLATAALVRAEGPPDLGFVVAAAGSGIAEIAGAAALYKGLAVGRMSLVAPISAAAPAVPLVAGLVLGEVPGPLRSVGLVLVVVGITFAARAPGSTGRVGPSVGYGLLSALGFGTFFVAMDSASEGDLLWALLVARLTAVAAIATATVATRSRPRIGRADLPVLLTIGTLTTAGDAMYATATTLGYLGVVAVLAALHSVVTIGLARIYLRERVAVPQQIGIAGCLAGVAVLAVA